MIATSDMSRPKLFMVGEARAAPLRSVGQSYAWLVGRSVFE